MKLYDASRPLYLETNASGTGLGVGLLQVGDGMNCLCDETLDNASLHPTTFPNKSLSSAE